MTAVLLGLSRRRAVSVVAAGRRHLSLLPVLAVAIVGSFWSLTSVGWGNAYYSGAVRSMGSSWHNFVFASFDDGFVSVDKPPLSLWVQVFSTKVFGYSQFAVLAPQAVAAVATVVLVYVGVQRSWGRLAGTVAAAGLAVTPMSVMVAHTTNTDATLVLLMTAATVALVEAVRGNSTRWFLAACAFGGLAVTAKMSAAVPVLPGLLGTWVWCAPRAWRRRLRDAVVGVVVLGIVGGWWFALVALTPAKARPYVGSTQRNSIVELAVERNGINQVDGTMTMGPGRGGQRFPGGGGFPGFPGGAPTGPSTANTGNGALGGLLPGVQLPPIAAPAPGATGAGGFRGPGGGPGGPGGPGGMFGLGFQGGTPGPLRLLNEALGSQAGWLLALAAVGALSAVVASGLRASTRLSAVLVMSSWAVAAGVVFSRTKGLVHPYYTAQLGPPIASLTGIGARAFVHHVRRRGWRRLGALLLPVGLGLTAWLQRTLLGRVEWRPWLSWTVVIACALSSLAVVAVIAVRRLGASRSALAGLTIVASAVPLVAPAAWTQGSLAAGANPMLPYANPTVDSSVRRINGGITPNGGTQFSTQDTDALVRFLRTHRRAERFDVGVTSAGAAEPLIINHGLRVMTLGGFIGNDPILTADQLLGRIKAGQVRYFLTGAGGAFRGGPFGANAAMSWVTSTCTEVPAAEWGGDTTVDSGDTAFAGGPSGSTFSLYDCRSTA